MTNSNEKSTFRIGLVLLGLAGLSFGGLAVASGQVPFKGLASKTVERPLEGTKKTPAGRPAVLVAAKAPEARKAVWLKPAEAPKVRHCAWYPMYQSGDESVWICD